MNKIYVCASIEATFKYGARKRGHAREIHAVICRKLKVQLGTNFLCENEKTRVSTWPDIYLWNTTRREMLNRFEAEAEKFAPQSVWRATNKSSQARDFVLRNDLSAHQILDLAKRLELSEAETELLWKLCFIEAQLKEECR